MAEQQKPARLRSSHDIKAILNGGFRWTGSTIRVVWKKSEEHETRFAVVVSRKIGSSVVRNRLKRVMREVIRANPVLACPMDIVCLARTDRGLRYAEVTEEYRTWLSHAGAQSPG
jgi:ribonuclease P protein component